jgi:hypothetical protein
LALVPGNQHSLRSASQLPSQRGEQVSGRVRPSGLALTGSVVELSLNRLTPSLMGARTAVRPLGSTDIAPLHRYYGPLRLPAAAAREVMDSLPALSPHHRGAPRRISQVPASLFRHAPSPITPDGSTDALARCFSADGRLHPLRKVGRRHLSVTRPYGFTCVRARVFAVRGHRPLACKHIPLQTGLTSRVRLPSRRRPQLHVERATHMPDTSQSGRMDQAPPGVPKTTKKH